MGGTTILSSVMLPAHLDVQKGIQSFWGSISDVIFDHVIVPGPRVICAKTSKSQFLQGFISPLKMKSPAHNWPPPGKLPTASIALQMCIQGEYSGRYLRN